MIFTKRILIQADKVALVFKNMELINILYQGKHKLAINNVVYKYNLTEQFEPLINRDILLKNKLLQNHLDMITIPDNQVYFQYLNGVFNGVLQSGTYAYWKNSIDFTYEIIELDKIEFSSDIKSKVLQLPALINYVNKQKVEVFEKALLVINGKYERILESGIYYFIRGSNLIELIKIDLRKSQMEINGQELLTKDKANIRINFQATYQVVDIDKAVKESSDFLKQVYILFQFAIRSFIGELSLDEMLANKTKLDSFVINYVAPKAQELGVNILNCGIRDIILPGDVKDILNQVLIAEKKAQANVIMRREETASTRSLLNTAKLMQDNKMLYKLKEMEYVERISENIQHLNLSSSNQITDQLKTLFSPG